MNDCWNCSQPGIPWPDMTSSARRICTRCDVVWAVVPMMASGELPTEVLHMGHAVPAVDFTRPGALSCPA